MKTLLKTSIAAAVAAVLPFAALANSDGTSEGASATELAQPMNVDNKVQVGQLTCNQTDRTNLIVFSKAKFDCSYEHADNGRVEQYRGTVNKVGVDLSTAKVETMIWYVFAPTSGLEKGGLAGNYVGASADAQAGVGGGIHFLVGGLDRSINMQPAAISGTEGIGVAVGIEKLNLDTVE